MTAPHPLSITDEGPFLDEIEDLDDLGELRRALLSGGATPAVSDRLCSWLLAKKTGQRDDSSPDTRARYRRILRELIDGRRGPKGKRARRRLEEFPILARVRARIEMAEADEAGGAIVAMLAAAAGAGTLAAAGHPVLAAAAAPIILDSDGEPVTSSNVVKLRPRAAAIVDELERDVA